MSVLSAARDAITRINGTRPQAVFSSTQQLEVEIAALCTEVAVDIMKKHEWQALTKIHTITGDGVTDAFPLPVDMDRMLSPADMENHEYWFWGYHHIRSMSEWIRNLDYLTIVPGSWIMNQNNFLFHPAPGVNAQARFGYISNYIATTDNGVEKKSFDNDTDQFVLDDRLLTLGLIWRYRAQKGLDYTEDLANYEIALSEAVTRDGGIKTIRSRRIWDDRFSLPWPYSLGGGL